MRSNKSTKAIRQTIYIVGEGATELYYFKHLKQIMGYYYSISPRLFENNSIAKIEKKITELLRENLFVICVFDADVSRRSEAENDKLENLKSKYAHNKNIIICDSLQSIEYWFLLHFEDTCRHFNNADSTEKSLKKYLPLYNKSKKFLDNSKWVDEITSEGKLQTATSRAKKYQNAPSYSNIYKAIIKLEEYKADLCK